MLPVNTGGPGCWIIGNAFNPPANQRLIKGGRGFDPASGRQVPAPWGVQCFLRCPAGCSGVFYFSGWDDGNKLTGFTGNSGLKPSKPVMLIDIEIPYRAFETDRIL